MSPDDDDQQSTTRGQQPGVGAVQPRLSMSLEVAIGHFEGPRLLDGPVHLREEIP